MSELGEISRDLRAVLTQLETTLRQFAALDRTQLAAIEAQLRAGKQVQAAALVSRARTSVRRAAAGGTLARRAGEQWLATHGSHEAGGSRGSGGTASTGTPGAGGAPSSFTSEAVAAAWSAGFATPGGRGYFSAKEPEYRESAETLRPFSREYTVDMHGRPARVTVGSQSLTAAELAELIRADPTWNGQPVRLFSCYTGQGKAPIAAELAKLLGVKVTAPTGWVSATADGTPVMGEIDVTEVMGEIVELPGPAQKGEWRDFHPG